MKSSYFWLLPAALLLTGCGTPKAVETPAEQKPDKADKSEIVLSEVQLASAALETQPATLSDAPGILQVKGRIVLADDRVWRVGIRTPGLVMVVYAGLGDRVNKGQVLARYHADEVREERAHYRVAVAELRLAETIATQAQRNRDRAQRLLDLKAGSVQQVEQAQQELVRAQAAIGKAQIEVERGKDLLEDDLKVSAEPPPASTGEFADDVPVIAPETGYIVEKNITPGKAIDLATNTFVIGDISKLWMLASVRQEDLPALRENAAVTVTLPGEPQRRFPGRIANLGQQFDPQTRTMQVRIAVDNKGNLLRPEMLADAEIPNGPRKPVLAIPSDAVQQMGDLDVVFVNTAAGHFAVRPVRTGPTLAGKTAILEGLQPGEKVVVHGSFVLKSQALKSTLESE